MNFFTRNQNNALRIRVFILKALSISKLWAVSVMKVGIVIIGRNEGQRLIDCLASLPKDSPIMYVDSNSTDQSVAEAHKAGAYVERLDMALPFTAARARNQGWKALLERHVELEYIQFLDGDCQLNPSWLGISFSFLEQNKQYAIACGRRRELYPESSLYNYICDLEWNTPVGDAKACGGDALIRVSVLREVQGYRESLIAGEEPEMCVRISQAGHKIRRIKHDMTWHDADMHRFSQWWRRSVRCGFAYANGVALHGSAPEYHWLKESVRAVSWGVFVPFVTLALCFFWSGLVIIPALLLYCIQWFRVYFSSPVKEYSKFYASLVVLSKFSESQGVLKFLFEFIGQKQSQIIEYK